MDPIVDQTGAPYFYAEDDPVNASDPLGLRVMGDNQNCNLSPNLTPQGDMGCYLASHWVNRSPVPTSLALEGLGELLGGTAIASAGTELAGAATSAVSDAPGAVGDVAETVAGWGSESTFLNQPATVWGSRVFAGSVASLFAQNWLQGQADSCTNDYWARLAAQSAANFLEISDGFDDTQEFFKIIGK